MFKGSSAVAFLIEKAVNINVAVSVVQASQAEGFLIEM